MNDRPPNEHDERIAFWKRDPATWPDAAASAAWAFALAAVAITYLIVRFG